MKKALLLLATLQLAACGSGSSSSDDTPKDTGTPDTETPTTNPTIPDTTPDNTNPEPQPDNVITGVLLDPYITQAKVCLDVNSNNSCDENELVVETNNSGAFTFTLTAALDADAKIIVLNRGSFQAPDYGYHAGIPYQLPLSSTVPVGENKLVVTPGSTASTTLNIDEATLVSIINQFSDKIGKTLTTADLTTDPFSDLVAHEVDANAIAVLRSNLVLYSVLRTLNAMQAIDTTQAINANFATEALIDTSKTYQLIESIVNNVAAGIDQDLIDEIQTGITQGNQGLIAASQTTMPDISTEVVMSTAAAIADLFVDQSIEAVISGLETHNTGSFTERFDAIATDVINGMATLSAESYLPGLVAELGTKTYGAVNKAHFDSYPSFVRDIIFNNAPLLQQGYECEDGHIALGYTFNSDFSSTSLSTVCTSAIPKQITEQVTTEKHDTEEGIEEDMWANLPAGSLRTSDVAQGCTFKGTVKDETDSPVQFVPMYMAFPAYELEMYVQTDDQGKFEFTHIPVEGHFGFNEVENHSDPQYFFGTYAGVHGAHPAFKTKESVSDFNVRCQNEGDIFTLNPIMKDIAANTKISGTLDTELFGEGFRIEIHAVVPDNTLKLNDTDQPRRAWIMDTIEDESDYNHPHLDLNSETGAYEIRSLAGGDYLFRVTVGKTEQREEFEFDITSNHIISVAAGASVTANLDLDESTSSYTLTVNGNAVSGNYISN